MAAPHPAGSNGLGAEEKDMGSLREPGFIQKGQAAFAACPREKGKRVNEVYFESSRKRTRTVATSARVAVPCGTSVVLERPMMRPEATAQDMGSLA